MRVGLRRRPRLPAEAAQAVGLPDGEQVLAWSALAVAGYAVVTPGALYLLTGFGKQVRRSWVEVDQLAWDADSRTLAVWWVGSRQAVGLELPEDSLVPEAAHERWRSSVLVTREVPLPGSRPAWVALRRDVDGTVTSQVKLPARVRADDPAVQAVTDAAARRLREEVGAAAAGAAPSASIWGLP